MRATELLVAPTGAADRLGDALRPKEPSMRATRLATGLAVALAAFTTLTAPVAAREVGSGTGGGTGAVVCNPVASLTVKVDAAAGETGVSKMQVDFTVKPCVKGQTLIVDALVAELENPVAVAYDDPNAPLSGRFTISGIRYRTNYKVTISTIDAATGLSAGSQFMYAGAFPKAP